LCAGDIIVIVNRKQATRGNLAFFSATDGLRGCPFGRSNHLSASGLPDGIYIFIPKNANFSVHFIGLGWKILVFFTAI
jgi:hypothetical protein